MEEIVNRLAYDSNVLNTEGVNSQECMFFIYKHYLVSIYKLTPISDESELVGDFENTYVIYDFDTDEVFNEASMKDNKLFTELPAIDNAHFDYDYTYSDEIESAKLMVRKAVSDYIDTKVLSRNYIDGLIKIYGYIDDSTKELIKFFIDNAGTIK